MLIGNIGNEPETKTLDSGVKSTRFSLAVTETRSKNGEKNQQTEWFKIVCWDRVAEIAEKYLVKGQQLFVEGKIRTRSWDDNGVKKYTTEIMAETITMLGGKKSDDGLPF